MTAEPFASPRSDPSRFTPNLTSRLATPPRNALGRPFSVCISALAAGTRRG